MIAFLLEAYAEDEAPNTKGGVDKRTVLRLDPRLAPVKAAVLPLSRHADLSPIARDLAASLRKSWNVEFDDAGQIGRRYRRQDEIGTPFCLTVDFETAGRPGGDDPRPGLDDPGAGRARPGAGLPGGPADRLLTAAAPASARSAPPVGVSCPDRRGSGTPSAGTVVPRNQASMNGVDVPPGEGVDEGLEVVERGVLAAVGRRPVLQQRRRTRRRRSRCAARAGPAVRGRRPG